MSREILKQIIDNFSPEDFIDFFRAKNRSFKPHNEDASEYDDGDFKNALFIGQTPFHQTENLIIYSFKVNENLSERSGKKLQYEKGKKILKDTQADTGIFIFNDVNDNFRFSLIYPEYTGTKRQWSYFKRFTYFVSPELTNKTFLQRIGDGDFSSIDTIKEAFSVEKVTKEFYSEIANWYFWAVKKSRFPEDAERLEKGRNIAVIRLITRIIFIWFMKVRGLVPDELFKEDKIKEILTDISPDESTYYNAILQNLFFATLNTRQDERKFRSETRGYKGYNPDYGNHGVYRYHRLFKRPESLEGYFDKIPFLNGGLFECLDFKSRLKEDRVYIDGFTDVAKHQPSVPNLLFFSKEREVDLSEEFGTQNRAYKVRGLLDLLTSYNFTIDENEPDDQEVALDPELLGRVFENLLASYNPETATTARKATGSYYTPREIVDYMVTQSLIQYFKSHLPSNAELDAKLTELFSTHSLNNPFDDSTVKRIIQLIESLRIVDPAVGSGAFPMGILNKLVFILSKLDPQNTLWKQAQIDSLKRSVTDPIVQKKLIFQVEQQFEDKNADYGRKLYLIEKCIYGVDIQQIAVEIAKLRFFISLLVDEKIDPKKPNHGIEPLPNLDFKLMQGNSLISTFAGIDFDNLSNLQYSLGSEAGTFISRFEEMKNQYQNEPDKDKKDALRKQIEDLLIKIFEERLKGFDFKRDIKQAEKDLIAYTEGRKPKDFFLWNLYFAEVFQEKGGFDVVIANPPYHQLSKDLTVKRDYKDYLKERFRTSGGRLNTFIFFLHEGIKLLLNKGNLVYIIPNTFLTQEYYKETRKLLLDKTNISQIVHYPTMQFENAIVENITIQLIKNGLSEKTSFLIQNSDKISFQAENNLKLKSHPPNYSFNITENSILEKIEKTKHITLNELCEINQAIALKGDKSISLRDNNSKGKFFKLLDGRNINRYSIKWGGVYLDYNLDRIHSCKKRDIFETNEKLLFRRVSSTLIFAYDTEKYYALNTIVVANKKHRSTDLKFLLGILNSKLINYYYREKYKSTKKVFSEIQARSVGKLPIKINDSSFHVPFITLVDQILAAKKKDPNADTSVLERQIDEMVYELYGLTPDEIAIVEGKK